MPKHIIKTEYNAKEYLEKLRTFRRHSAVFLSTINEFFYNSTSMLTPSPLSPFTLFPLSISINDRTAFLLH